MVKTGDVPLIAHIEVGGSLGGSTFVLDTYLRYCDANRLRHEVVFYQRPPESGFLFQGNYPTIDLGFAIPPQSNLSNGRRRERLRTILSGLPAVQTLVVTIRGGLRLLADLPQVIRLAKLFRERNYTLVHSNNSFTYQSQTILACWLARKPLVAHFRSTPELNPLHQWLSGKVLSIVTLSSSLAEQLRRQRVRSPIQICRDPHDRPSTPSADSVVALRRELLGTGTILVGTVSRLEDRKGIEDFLAATRLLQERWPHARYVVIGTGSKASFYQQLAKESGLCEKVRFLGFISDLSKYYAAMDAFVCPSCAEGAQGVLLEAMLQGTTVVATRVGWAPELIRNGENGLLVEPGDVEGLAAAVDELLGDAGRRRAIATNGRASAKDFANPAATSQELDETFVHALSSLSASRLLGETGGNSL
jgi:glycosyltransferase involved in cell wall biosynthesis